MSSCHLLDVGSSPTAGAKWLKATVGTASLLGQVTVAPLERAVVLTGGPRKRAPCLFCGLLRIFVYELLKRFGGFLSVVVDDCA